MNTNKEMKRQLSFYMFMAFTGAVALFIGYVLKFEPHIMSGVAIGFLPVGIIGSLLYIFGKNNTKFIKAIKLENEERNVFINNKAGRTAFWITYWYMFIATMGSKFLNISLGTFAIITLLFMCILYFVVLAIYHHKY